MASANLWATSLGCLGTALPLLGTYLLWKNSPSGYGPGLYANEQVLAELRRVNQQMARRQQIAIALIAVGTACAALAGLVS